MSKSSEKLIKENYNVLKGVLDRYFINFVGLKQKSTELNASIV